MRTSLASIGVKTSFLRVFVLYSLISVIGLPQRTRNSSVADLSLVICLGNREAVRLTQSVDNANTANDALVSHVGDHSQAASKNNPNNSRTP